MFLLPTLFEPVLAACLFALSFFVRPDACSVLAASGRTSAESEAEEAECFGLAVFAVLFCKFTERQYLCLVHRQLKSEFSHP